MKFRKILALSLSVSMMAGVLAGCGGGSGEGTSSPDDVSEPAQVGTADGTYNVDNIETLTLKVNTSASANTPDPARLRPGHPVLL